MKPGRHPQDNPRAARCELQKYPALHSGGKRKTPSDKKKLPALGVIIKQKLLILTEPTRHLSSCFRSGCRLC
jgi:hypothetical protein